MSDKIAVIICVAEKNEWEHIIEELQKAYIPDGYSIDIMVYPEVTNRARSYNNAIQGTSAKYKLFFNAPVERINSRIFCYVVDFFSIESSIGVLGVLGSELPIDADYRNAEEKYGTYYWGNSIQQRNMNVVNPLFYQHVSIVESNFFATSLDFLFDETIGDFFLVPAYCCSAKNNGYKSIVAMQNDNDIWITFKEQSLYEKAADDLRYDAHRADFCSKYNRIFLPLVSILIPAYNNTSFLKEALESAISQDYPNIEIIIGDDSTTDEVKLFVEPYLNKYDDIMFYHHGGPLGGRGVNNINFLLGKSRGEYIKLLFHDDILTGNSISEMMKYYVRDMDCKIGLITSVREAIDESGRVLGTVSPWVPREDTIISPGELTKKVLHSGYNFLGEYSTVLIRKDVLWVDEHNKYRIGHYKGFVDRHMADISSWLMVASKSLDCVFIRNRLSYFRMHSNQNTYDNNIQVGARLDWYALCMLSFNYDEAFDEAEECFHIIKRMDAKFKPMLSNGDVDGDFIHMYDLYKRIHENIIKDDRDTVFGLIEEYIKENSH